MTKIKSKMPIYMQFAPRKSWWPRFLAYWRTLAEERGAIDRQAVITDIILRGLDSAEAELASKKR